MREEYVLHELNPATLVSVSFHLTIEICVVPYFNASAVSVVCFDVCVCVCCISVGVLRPDVSHGHHSHFTREEEDEVAENLQEIYNQEGYRVTRSSRGISSIILGNESSVIDGRFSSSFSVNDDGFVSVEVGPKLLFNIITCIRERGFVFLPSSPFY